MESIHPYYEFRSFSLNPEFKRLGTDVTITADSFKQTVKFSLDNTPQTYFIVVPYTKSQKIDKQLKEQYGDADNGICLSYNMAELLGVSNFKGENMKMEFEIGIPVKMYKDELTDSNNNQLATDLDLLDFTNLSLDIAGIVKQDVANRYSINGNNIVYLPQSIADMYLSKQISISDNEFSSEEFELIDWRSSSYRVYANTYNDIESTKMKIQQINSNFIAKCDYQDTLAMDQMLSNMTTVISVVINTILVIVFVLVSAIFMTSTFARSREVAILKANGLTQTKLIALMAVESLIQSIKIILISSAIVLIGALVINSPLFGASIVSFRWEYVAYLLLASIVFVSFPTLLSVFYSVKVKPDRVLRN